MKLTDLTPNLITNDIDRALTFYRDVLGFDVVATVPEEPPLLFVWVKRDDVNVFLNDARAVHEETPVGSLVVGQSGVALFIHMEGIADWWEQMQHKTHVVMPLKDQWYGQTEFSITDPDGYVITFAERTAKERT
jgi:uncharacterized glyoxalase superfamily protein PhnB